MSVALYVWPEPSSGGTGTISCWEVWKVVQDDDGETEVCGWHGREATTAGQGQACLTDPVDSVPPTVGNRPVLWTGE